MGRGVKGGRPAYPAELAPTVTTLGGSALFGYMEVHKSAAGGLGPKASSAYTQSMSFGVQFPVVCTRSHSHRRAYIHPTYTRTLFDLVL